MNKKGFTLVELLATMAILAMISVIAVPNVLKIMDSNKKEKVLNDGLTVISLAKREVASNRELGNSLNEEGIRKPLNELDETNDITKDPDGKVYNRQNSYVNVAKVNNVITYCVYLESENWRLSDNDGCVYEDSLWLDNAKQFAKEVEN